MNKIKWSIVAAAILGLFSTAYADELPVKGSVREVVQDAAGLNCAVTTDSDLYCWGIAGFTGIGTTEPQLTPVKIMDNVRTVKLSYGQNCAIKNTGDLYCWGDNRYGQVGSGTTNEVELSPVKILEDVKSVFCDYFITCATKTTGELYCWGENILRRVGPSDEKTLTPQKILDNVASVSIGDSNICALSTQRELYCWGNGGGVLPDESVGTVPEKIFDNVEKVIVSHSDGILALKDTGELFRWEQALYSLPYVFLDNVASFGEGWAILNSGDLYRWGWSLNGEIGNGVIGEEVSTPVKVLDNVSSVSIGGYVGDTVCAAKTTGELYCWGSNETGFVGNGDEINDVQATPVKVLDGVSSVSIGWNGVAAIKTSGELFYWGYNGNGSYQRTPVSVLEDVRQVNNLRHDVCATKKSGELYCWGMDNFSGPIGEWLSEPQQVFDGSGIPTEFNPKVPATGIVTPKTQLLPPYVVEEQKKLTVYMERFAEASLKPVLTAAKVVQKAAKFKYEVMILEKRGKKGTFKTTKEMKKNTFNIKRKKTSVYTIKYRVVINQGKKTKRTKWSKAVKVTKQSK